MPAGTATFWLTVSAEEAVRRASTEPRARPLLDRPDALAEASRLLAERSRFYAAAQWTVDTEDLPVEDVSARILEILSREYGEAWRE